MLSYIFAIVSFAVGIFCLTLSKNRKYFATVESKYGQPAAEKVVRSLRIWGIFFLVASGILMLSLALEGGR